ncbi:Gfo/Idh/MocA family oxidoreductase [Rapidithrix thailandica]|uniref:Gfo/Idh/MocA family oxidoreductase n=1 Tax=Rapidithrix thailandica TaxID=413964 RepID=A0AAW9RU60_9BACT
MSEVIKWGFIGCGAVTELKSGPAFHKIPGSEVIAVMRRNAQKAEDYAKRHGIAKWYTDAEALIHDPEVNAVYIATPPGSHAEYCKKVAAAGKHVYVEKPMARNHAECLEMLEACAKAGVKLFVAYYRRTLPHFLWVKDQLQKGAIGEVRLVNLKLYKHIPSIDHQTGELMWRVFPDVAGGGHFYDLASHQLDYLDFALGPIAEASGIKSNQADWYPAEDIVMGNFRFESGVLGTGAWCFTTHQDDHLDEIEIIGSKGKIRFSTFGEPLVKLYREGHCTEHRFELPENIQFYLIKSIVEELQGKVVSCPSTGISAARTNRVMEQICS